VSGAVGGTADAFGSWVISPAQLASWVAPVTYIGLIAAALSLTLVRGWRRLVLLVPTLYLAAFVWENVMIGSAGGIAPMRYIVLGLLLIGLMVLRPNGLLGERRVEIV
jgi:ABC-type branched-subunit amino acid transport system permease subunit